MEREIIKPGKDWQQTLKNMAYNKVEDTRDTPYWTTDACYHFTPAQIKVIAAATNELHALCTEAMGRIVKSGAYYERLGISEKLVPYIKLSWNDGSPEVYSRYDLAFNGKGQPQLLGVSADSASSLFESAVLQREWLGHNVKLGQQFNEIETQLTARWSEMKRDFGLPLVYFTALHDKVEDRITIDLLQKTAAQAGLKTQAIDLGAIGYDHRIKAFTDLENRAIKFAVKYYPWDLMLKDDFGQYALDALSNKTGFIEPLHKMLLNAVPPVLSEMFPKHPNLMHDFSRVKNFDPYQQLPDFGMGGTITGSWVVGERAAGIGMREETAKGVKFVPHYVM